MIKPLRSNEEAFARVVKSTTMFVVHEALERTTNTIPIFLHKASGYQIEDKDMTHSQAEFHVLLVQRTQSQLRQSSPDTLS